MALTKAKVEALTYDPDGPRRQVEYDGGNVPGFGLRLLPSGRKSWILQYRPRGSPTPRMMTLGDAGLLTVAQARTMASKALRDAEAGDDPMEARRKAREARMGETVADLAQMYVERHARHLKTRADIERRIERRILPALGRMKVVDVEPRHVAKLHHDIGADAPVEANRVRTLLHGMFEKARKPWGLLPRTAPNPVAEVEPFRERSREVWATPDRVPALWGAIMEEPDVAVRVLFRLLLLTGARKSELLNLRWRHVNRKRGEIRLPDTKAGEEQRIPLSDAALAVLGELPRGLPAVAVFQGPTGKPRADVAKAWRRIRARWWLAEGPEAARELRERAEREVRRRSKHAPKDADAVDAHLLRLAFAEADRFTIHDLRRTAGGLMANSGISAKIIGRALRNPSAVDVYTRIADETARAALQDHGARVAALVAGAAD